MNTISDGDFVRFQRFIYDYCGIFFSDDNAYIVHRRLQPRLEALALVDFAEYYRYLRSCDP